VVEEGVTLKEAILAVNEEWSDEASPRLTDYDRVAAVGAETRAQSAEILASGVAPVLLALAQQLKTPAEEFVSICIRFGMRVQRKLDHPERVTSVYTGAVEVEAETDKEEPPPAPKVTLN
jgi:hypothetical protein